MGNLKDWTDKKFGMITLKHRSPEKQGNGYKWFAICDCGKEILVSPAPIANGSIISCGCYKKLKSHKDNYSRIFPPHLSSARNVWGRYKKDGISFDDFYRLSQSDCFYCGIKPFKIFNVYNKSGNYCTENQKINGDFIFNGLDRVDNNLKHTIENVVPCCCNCNFMKKNLTKYEFFTMIKNIYEKHCVENNISKKYYVQTELFHKFPLYAKYNWKRYYKDNKDLSFNEFYYLSQQNCYYCDKQPSNKSGGFRYNGLDRLDNTITHTFENVVPCCKDCNFAKASHTLDKFLLFVKNIYEYKNLKNLNQIKNKNQLTLPFFCNNENNSFNLYDALYIEDIKTRTPKSLCGENHYNFGKPRSEETKQKISKANSGENHYNFNGTLSEEHKQKISRAGKGRKHSAETKEQISKSHIGKISSTRNPYYNEIIALLNEGKRPIEIFKILNEKVKYHTILTIKVRLPGSI